MVQGQINPNMLVLARQLRGITQKGLAIKINVSQGKVSKMEQGLLNIDNEILNKISKKLDFPMSFFLQNCQIYPAGISLFRKKQALSKKDMDYINSRINYNFIALQKLLDSIEVDTNVPHFDIQTFGNPKNIARALRDYWKVPQGPINNLTSLLESAGIFVFHLNVHFDKFDGIRFNVDSNIPMITLNKNQPSDRMRFSLAHELGHIIMHKSVTPTAEDEADQFASEFLIPSDEVRFPNRIQISDLADLKRYWKVSMQSLLMKASELNRLSNNQSRYLWQQISSLGFRKREPAELDPPFEEISLVKQLLKLHQEELEYTNTDLQKLFAVNSNDFEDWWGTYLPNFKKSQLKLRLGGLSN